MAMFGQGLLSTGPGAISAAAAHHAASRTSLQQLLRRPCRSAAFSCSSASRVDPAVSTSGRPFSTAARSCSSGTPPAAHHPSSQHSARALTLGWTCGPFRRTHTAQGLISPLTTTAGALAEAGRGARRAGAVAETSKATKRAGAVAYSPLHHNIAEFCDRIVPTYEEKEIRDRAVKIIRTEASRVFQEEGRINTEVFGSFATGLSMWNSDVDLVVTGLFEPDRNSGGYDMARRATVAASLARLAKSLRMARGIDIVKLQLIRRARVPIIKLTTRAHLAVDICMADDSGPRAARYMAAQARTYPPVTPLVLVLKTYLRSCGVNDVVNGGLSSYSLTNMVIAHLQEELKAGRDINDLGESLYSFLVRYSEEFDYSKDAVSVASGGIVPRATVGVINAGDIARSAANSYGEEGVAGQQRLLVDCPLTGRDVSNGSFRIDLVRDAFAAAARKLELLASQKREGWATQDFLMALFDTQHAVRRPSLRASRPPSRSYPTARGVSTGSLPQSAAQDDYVKLEDDSSSDGGDWR